MNDRRAAGAAAGIGHHAVDHHVVEDEADAQVAAAVEIIHRREGSAQLAGELAFLAWPFEPGLDVGADAGEINRRAQDDAFAFGSPRFVQIVDRAGFGLDALYPFHALGDDFGHLLRVARFRIIQYHCFHTSCLLVAYVYIHLTHTALSLSNPALYNITQTMAGSAAVWVISYLLIFYFSCARRSRRRPG